MDQGSLSGVRVVEVGVFMAAPFAGMQLADLGADVVKVEPPRRGDPARQVGPYLQGEGSAFVRLNRNKRSVAVDLKHPGGKAVLTRLLTTADVFLQNLRPGVMDALGFDYESVRALNPRLVYVSLSGWGQDGPRASLPGLDVMAQARAGLMSITGEPDGPPAKVGVPLCDLTCGLYGALAALAALRARDAGGEGQHVDVSLFESAVSMGIWEAGRYFATGEVGGRLGSAHQSTAPYQAFATADGWVTFGAVTPRSWVAACDVLGLAELADDPRYADAYQRQLLRSELTPVIERATRGWQTEDLVRALERAGVPCAPIADYAEVFTDAHLRERDYYWDAPHPTLGAVRQLGSPMRMSATPPVRGRAGPSLGADSREVLREAGFAMSEIEGLEAAGAVQHGGPDREGRSE
ncbi:CaiB/BaiF CoA transferase family protein [Actinopolymorpha singaporensis]|uniref:Formyl-CoA transferase n=1 Tax=Actinopolymorpha singaporensis TaxID=117157 RepID=A0A1H1WFK0_9ACTN|nr:CoA transferase [Actinopolymorpha singaporensis]SDS95815.1 formyl-CoA transferase [Actinopolymorpha singaporensis]